ncbi:protein of unknown function [Pseudomonas sp. JV551A1]|nr:protein of unknown function [Pseudomonas sp. JV551A1]
MQVQVSGNVPGLVGNGVDFWVFCKRHERAGTAIKGVDTAGLDVIDPAMQGHTAFFKRQADGWVSLDVGQLRDDVFAHHGSDFAGLIHVTTGLIYDLGRVGVPQPTGHGGHVIQALACGNGGHRTTVGVAADHDVCNVKSSDRVFDRGRNATWLWPIRRHDIAGVADDKQIAGLALGDQFRHQSAVRAGDEERLWRLLIGQILEQFDPLRKGVLLKLQKSVDDRFHGCCLDVAGCETKIKQRMT